MAKPNNEIKLDENLVTKTATSKKWKDSHGRIWKDVGNGEILCINPNGTPTNTEQPYKKVEYDKIGETFEEVNE